jgi:type II secretory pathway predicted ATPase ExeA
MYEAFFGLRSRPFSVTPSADLFFHSVTHRRTLAYLQGQALAGEPLIVLTGDIGAGKTTVLQVLLRNLSDKFAPAVVVSTSR